MGTQGVHVKRVTSLAGLLSSLRRYKRFLSCLDALVSPEQNIFFLTVHFFTSFVLIAQQAGQAVVPCRLSHNKYLWFLVYREEVKREGCVRDTSGHAALALLDIFRKGVNKYNKGTVSRNGYCFEGLKILISTFCVCDDGIQGALSKAFHFHTQLHTKCLNFQKISISQHHG